MLLPTLRRGWLALQLRVSLAGGFSIDVSSIFRAHPMSAQCARGRGLFDPTQRRGSK